MISRIINQCPYCGCKVFSVYDQKGWRITCSYCDYSGRSAPTELKAEENYRGDYNREFEGKASVKCRRFSNDSNNMVPDRVGSDHLVGKGDMGE